MPIFLIVGAHFRPPAKALLQVLPLGLPLMLIAEPSNEHDPDAIRVEVVTSDIPLEQHTYLNTLAAGYGYDLDSILAQDSWHLGYIPRKDTARLRADWPPTTCEWIAEHSFTPDGKSGVKPIEALPAGTNSLGQ